MPDNDGEENKFNSQRSMQSACDKTGGHVVQISDQYVRSPHRLKSSLLKGYIKSSNFQLRVQPLQSKC